MRKLHVAVIRPFPADAAAHFASFKNCVFTDAPDENTEVILGNPSRETVAAAKNLRWIQLTNAGVNDWLNREDVKSRGITLTCASGAFGQSISECVLAMILSLYKHLNLFRDNQRECLWRDAGRQMSPRGKNLLVLGAGNIGCSVAQIMKPFGVRAVGVRTRAGEGDELFEKYITFAELDAYLPKADIVVCALPETKQTIGLFDARRLALIPETAIIVNVGRGSLIDCNALADALNKGEIYGAGLDVTSPEPLPPEHPLWRCPNAIITPHATGGSFGHLTETEEKIYEIASGNLTRYLNGQPLQNAVNFETGYRESKNRV